VFKNQKPFSVIKEKGFFGIYYDVYYFLSSSLRALPALNLGTFTAGILIFCVGFCGLTPVRAARNLTLKAPKPVKTTSSPFLSNVRLYIYPIYLYINTLGTLLVVLQFLKTKFTTKKCVKRIPLNKPKLDF
jgi:hypothetical protein